MKRILSTAASILLLCTSMSSAAELKSIGISLASLGNPFFVALASGAEAEAKKINPSVKVITVGFEQDLNKQVDQIDNFIAAGVQMIMLNPGDPNALAPAIQKAKDAGIVVVSVDTAAKGADLTVTTNNRQAGEISCQYIVDKLNGEGDVIIQNGPQNSAIIDRVEGCKSVFEANPGIKILSDDQNGKSSRDGGLEIMQSQLTRFPKIDAVFAVADPQAIGSSLAMKQLNREGIVIASVDGAPDIESELKNPKSPSIQATASQDPYMMARTAVELGYKALNGEKPENPVVLLDSKLVTRDNVEEYQGWEAQRD
ncbi:ABC transporter substrate-binding protein [Falsochrobactrum sp. TDYN1]|uniref:ABC transporter substrate-binding protein n=1 Tax=Falsochrobactrum tianjinense TaxID=2706015 RepID=A0A949UVI5_9HYPH|nr:ABC transporter substrate-binding protein [Falsochrobactrum sp. TDYN1]MBV2144897.1 ABC transporter substrate-binding protein [Falsochrobactrum sp. TDYN1]